MAKIGLIGDSNGEGKSDIEGTGGSELEILLLLVFPKKVN